MIMKHIYRAGTWVSVDNIEEHFLAATRLESDEYSITTPLEKQDLPKIPGLITMVVARRRDCHGFIRVRWGELFTKGAIEATFGEGG
jgi:hypothetical protein